MSGGIYLIKDDGGLVKMNEQQHETEDMFQELLANYPDLLAGEQMNQTNPRRWLLISREAGVPDEEEGSTRWSLDHLFLDQDGIPTMVEVKRSSDTRIRREVVGQMLDYAANGVAYWSIEELQSRFRELCQQEGTTPDERIQECFGMSIDEDQFWMDVKTNLQAGRVRLLFVADEIPKELRRIVEFLNSQMDPAEVLAVEIKQYGGEGLKTLVPRVLGQTAEAEQKKRASTSRSTPWTQDEFLQRLEANGKVVELEVARRIIAWAAEHGLRCEGGRGGSNASLSYLSGTMRLFRLTQYYQNPSLELPFKDILNRPNGPLVVDKMCEVLNRLDVVNLSNTDKYPSVFLTCFHGERQWNIFAEAMDAVIANP